MKKYLNVRTSLCIYTKSFAKINVHTYIHTYIRAQRHASTSCIYLFLWIQITCHGHFTHAHTHTHTHTLLHLLSVGITIYIYQSQYYNNLYPLSVSITTIYIHQRQYSNCLYPLSVNITTIYIHSALVLQISISTQIWYYKHLHPLELVFNDLSTSVSIPTIYIH